MLKVPMHSHPLAVNVPTERLRDAHDAAVATGLDYKASAVGLRAVYEAMIVDVMAKLRPTFERAIRGRPSVAIRACSGA